MFCFIPLTSSSLLFNPRLLLPRGVLVGVEYIVIVIIVIKKVVFVSFGHRVGRYADGHSN